MTVLLLSMASLVLSAGSDDETVDEETWVRRFETIDEKRVEHNIPPLSAEERLRLLLGRPPLDRPYALVITYQEHDRDVIKANIRQFTGKLDEPCWVAWSVHEFITSEWSIYFTDLEEKMKGFASKLYIRYARIEDL
jgi:hypothetical protein